MRIPSSAGRSSLQFNITPLIDVVFQLIIFFLVASYFVKHDINEPVTLPDATQQDKADDDSPRRLVLTVTATGRWFRGVEPVSLERIEQLIAAGAARHQAGFEVRIRGDRDVPYRAVEPIMTACAKAGVRQLKFAVNVLR